jgi:sphinganine-1-phosphate aldolase
MEIPAEYRVPLTLATCAVIARLHLYRYIRRFILPAAAGALVYRIMNNSESLLSILANYVIQRSDSKVFRLIGDVLGFLLAFIVVKLTSQALQLNYATIKKYVVDTGYEMVKNIPMVKNELDKEKSKMEADLDKTLKTRSRVPGQVLSRLPEKGMSRDDILGTMRNAVSNENKRWQDGKVSGSVYLKDSSHQELLNEAFGLYSLANPLHPDLWPSGMKYESEIIAMTASMMTTKSKTVSGSTTSGGTDSIILAIKTHRDYYRHKYGITSPEMICCVTAHAAVDKACELLCIKLVKVPCCPRTYKVNVNAVERAIGPNTIMMYSSAPTFPQGVIDPISALSRLAVKYQIGLHVDCCLGGFILPFARKLGYSVPGILRLSTYYLFA